MRKTASLMSYIQVSLQYVSYLFFVGKSLLMSSFLASYEIITGSSRNYRATGWSHWDYICHGGWCCHVLNYLLLFAIHNHQSLSLSLRSFSYTIHPIGQKCGIDCGWSNTHGDTVTRCTIVLMLNFNQNHEIFFAWS